MKKAKAAFASFAGKAQAWLWPRRHILDATWPIEQDSTIDCGPVVVARIVAAATGTSVKKTLRMLSATVTSSSSRIYVNGKAQPFATPPGRLRTLLREHRLPYSVAAGTKEEVRGVIQNALAKGNSVAVLVHEGAHWALLHGWQHGVVGVVNPGGDKSYPYAYSYEALWSEGGMLEDSVPTVEEDDPQAQNPKISYEGKWIAVAPDDAGFGSPEHGSADSGKTLGRAADLASQLMSLHKSWAGCDQGPKRDHYFTTDDAGSPTKFLVPWHRANGEALFGFDSEGSFRLAAHGVGVEIGELTVTSAGRLAPANIQSSEYWNGLQRVMSLAHFTNCQRVNERWRWRATSGL